MDLNQSTMFQMMKQRMEHSVERQKVLSQNLANANTPKYLPKDVRNLDFKNELRRASGLTPVATNPSHLQGMRAAQEFKTETQRNPETLQISGNAVSIEDELVKVNDTQGMYSLMTNLYKKNTDMLKMVIRRP